MEQEAFKNVFDLVSDHEATALKINRFQVQMEKKAGMIKKVETAEPESKHIDTIDRAKDYIARYKPSKRATNLSPHDLNISKKTRNELI